MTGDLQLRDIDQAVLQHIVEDHNDTQKITQATTLENHRVRYSLEKLEQQGLITVENPDTMVERVIDGQKRVFQHPKQAELTEDGEQYLAQNPDTEKTMYSELSRDELIQKVHSLEADVEQLEEKFNIFRSQIQQKL